MKEQNDSPPTSLQTMKFHQLFAVPQPSQGSIYLFSPFLVDQKTGCHSMLFGTLNGRFTLAGFAEPSDKSKGSAGPKLPWEPCVRDIFFTEIGANPIRDRTVEVFSLHVYQRKSGNQVFIGVTFSQNRRAFDPSSLIRTRTSTASRTEQAVAAHGITPAVAGTSTPQSGMHRAESADSSGDHLTIEQHAILTGQGSPTKSETGSTSTSSSDQNVFHIYANGPDNVETDSDEDEKQQKEQRNFQEQKLIDATGRLIYRQTLTFLPTHLTSLSEERSFGRPTFLLGGGDGHVHVFTHASGVEFSDDAPFLRVTDEETDISTKFPEFAKIHLNQVKTSAGTTETSPVTWISYHFKDDASHHCLGISAIGFRDGSVSLTLVDVDTESLSAVVKSSLLLSHFGPILAICLFDDDSDEENDSSRRRLNMLVCPSLEPCLVYSFDLRQQQTATVIEQVCELPHPPSSSASAPVPLSAIVADVNFDGQKEILVGFCDKTILVYKHTSQQQQPTSESTAASWSLCPEFCHGISPHLPGPIHNIYYGPLLQCYNGDAMKSSCNNSKNNKNKAALLQQALSYLAIFTTSGLLVLQHDLRAVMELCKRRLEQSASNNATPPRG